MNSTRLLRCVRAVLVVLAAAVVVVTCTTTTSTHHDEKHGGRGNTRSSPRRWYATSAWIPPVSNTRTRRSTSHTTGMSSFSSSVLSFSPSTTTSTQVTQQRHHGRTDLPTSGGWSRTRRRRPIACTVCGSSTSPNADSSNNDSTTTITSSKVSSSSPLATSNSTDELPALVPYQIRDCQYYELGQVADLIVESFYTTNNNNAGSSVWKQLYRLGELNRLQRGYSYGDQKVQHRMLVVELDSSSATEQQEQPRSKYQDGMMTIVGFCDLDFRAPTQYTGYKHNPRPYLSDLCIHPNYRRMGLAQALVRQCEEYGRQQWHSSNNENNRHSTSRTVVSSLKLYIRVERSNDAALTMYRSMGYAPCNEGPSSDTNNGKLLLLCKELILA